MTNIRKVEINTTDFLNKIIPETIEKDLNKNEQICETCGGFGLVVKDYFFWLKNVRPLLKKEKYNKPYLGFCPDCYFGVQKVCKYCGKVLGKKSQCDCEEYQLEIQHKKAKQINNWYKKAEKITLKQAIERNIMLYNEFNSKYYTVNEIYSGYLKDDYYEEGNLPNWLFGTHSIDLGFDAYHLLENATEELHEGAYDNISSEDIIELQNFLDEWCEKQLGTKTYYPDHDVIVLLDGDY